jgi:predicted MFS family arabinose efflux permease
MAFSTTESKNTSTEQSIQEWFSQQAHESVHGMTGGWARLKVLVLLACVLALDSADKATIGAIAVPLKHSLHIGNMEIGLLVTASTGIGALATLPMGILVDRINRVNLLVASIILWSGAMAVSGAANSFAMLLVTRLALGAVIAAVTPVMASLTGDYFRPGVRGRIWGYILSGELLGAGLGILISGEVAAVISWRFSFWVLSVVGLLLTLAIWQWLPEPARGNQRYLPKDKAEIPTDEELQDPELAMKKEEEVVDENKVEEKIVEGSIEPHEEQVLEKNPKEMPFWHAVRYILSIRTNVLIIIASACGYFFFTGLRTFIMVYAQGQFNLSQATSQLVVVLIGLGAIVGVLITGRTADDLIERGHISARITVSGVAFLITAIAFLAGFYIESLLFAAPLLFIGATSLGGVNAPIDAARLDIMNARLWGRAESVRAVFRFTFEAIAPILFGWVSMLLGGQGGFFGGSGGGATALGNTFKIMLIPVVIAVIVLFLARKTYPRDVATVLASEE